MGAEAAEILLTFRHRVIALWEHNAQDYLQKDIIPMYTFLPAMKGVNASLLLQAIDGMKQHYTKWRLGDQHEAMARWVLNTFASS